MPTFDIEFFDPKTQKWPESIRMYYKGYVTNPSGGASVVVA